MNRRTLIGRSLRHYWRTHVGVTLAAAVATAVLIGALLVGDSVRGSLRAQALARLGGVHLAMETPNRFFREELSAELAGELDADVAPALALTGSAQAGDTYAGGVRILGVDERFWWLGRSKLRLDADSPSVVVNRRLAERLGIEPGGTVTLRFARPDPLTRDAPLASDARDRNRDFVRAELAVRAVAGEDDFGRFDLQANQVAPYNAFVPLAWLQERAELATDEREDRAHARVNLLLVGEGASREDAASALRRHWTLADAESELRTLPDQGDEPRVLELRSRRVFLPRPLAHAAARANAPALGVFTYLANELRGSEGAMPYSMVTALGFLNSRPAEAAMPDDPAWRIAASLEGKARINTYLAEQLTGSPDAAPDRLEMRYFAMSGGDVTKRTETLDVAAPPVELPAPPRSAEGMLLRRLTPSLPALPEDATFTDLPKLGTRIDKSVIDEHAAQLDAYYARYRLTPVAYLPLRRGQALWGSPLGDLTSVRFPPDAESRVRAAVRENLDPASLGAVFRPVRKQALQAGRESLDFGQLFLGMSMFLIAAAVLLLGLLFVFGVEQRGEEMGLLRAVGLPAASVRRLLLAEGAVLAGLGAALGTAGGVAYTRAVLRGLATVWRGAVPRAAIGFHARPASIAIGAGAGLLIAMGAMWLTLRRKVRRPPHELLAGQHAADAPNALGAHRWKLALGLAAVCVAGAGVVLSSAGRLGEAVAFFLAGALLLLAAMAGAYAALARVGGSARRLTLRRLGRRNAARRRWRSLATIGLLACGSFLLVSVAANRKDPLARAGQRDSGTGGFALYATTSVGLLHAPTSPAGRETLDLGGADLGGVEVVPMRVHGGEEASCLNLNRPMTPRLLGLRPEALARRDAFSFARTWRDAPPSWDLLNDAPADGAIPAVADMATVQWVLQMKLGDTLTYRDERGEEFQVRLVGGLKNSILQGSVLVAERHFAERYPSETGYRAMLVDAPQNEATRLRNELAAAPDLRAAGIELTLATERLAALTAVENTYLAIFQALGGLGLLLGSIALGLVVLRNVLERRRELALLRAVGYSRGRVLRLLLAEHWLLLVAGVLCGAVAGFVAVLPALPVGGGQRGNIPYLSLLGLLGAVTASGALWAYLAAQWAMRGDLMGALRSE